MTDILQYFQCVFGRQCFAEVGLPSRDGVIDEFGCNPGRRARWRCYSGSLPLLVTNYVQLALAWRCNC